VTVLSIRDRRVLVAHDQLLLRCLFLPVELSLEVERAPNDRQCEGRDECCRGDGDAPEAAARSATKVSDSEYHGRQTNRREQESDPSDSDQAERDGDSGQNRCCGSGRKTAESGSPARSPWHTPSGWSTLRLPG
jgi:hypothetical protein